MIRGDFDSNCENDSLYGVIVMLVQKRLTAETGDTNDDID